MNARYAVLVPSGSVQDAAAMLWPGALEFAVPCYVPGTTFTTVFMETTASSEPVAYATILTLPEDVAQALADVATVVQETATQVQKADIESMLRASAPYTFLRDVIQEAGYVIHGGNQ